MMISSRHVKNSNVCRTVETRTRRAKSFGFLSVLLTYVAQLAGRVPRFPEENVVCTPESSLQNAIGPGAPGCPCVDHSAKSVLRNHKAGSARWPVPSVDMMRIYSQQHRFYCGIDLHARSMFIHLPHEQGRTRFEQDCLAFSEPSGASSPVLIGTRTLRLPSLGSPMILAPPGASTAAEDAPGDDRKPNHRGATEVSKVDRVCRKGRRTPKKNVPVEGTSIKLLRP